MPEFLSSWFIQPMEDSLFSYGYVFREVEEELLSRYEKEGPVVMEHVSLEGLFQFLCIFFAPSVVEGICLKFLEMNSGLCQEYFLTGWSFYVGFADVEQYHRRIWRILFQVCCNYRECWRTYAGSGH